MKSVYQFGVFDKKEMASAIRWSFLNERPVSICMYDLISTNNELTYRKSWHVVYWNTPGTYVTRHLYTEYTV